jgi:hypothetical protein
VFEGQHVETSAVTVGKVVTDRSVISDVQLDRKVNS